MDFRFFVIVSLLKVEVLEGEFLVCKEEEEEEERFCVRSLRFNLDLAFCSTFCLRCSM